MSDMSVVDGSREEARQLAVAKYNLAGSEAWQKEDAELKALAVQAQRVLGVDFCAINIIDGDLQRQIGGTPGVPVAVSLRSASLCARILDTSVPVFVTADASHDERLADSPWVNSEISATRFYAAAPLRDQEGLALGTVCAWSEEVFSPDTDQLAQLATIRDAVMDLLHGRATDRDAAAKSAAAQTLPGIPGFVGGQAAPSVVTKRVSAGTDTTWSIDTVIDTGGTRTLFQPIVHLSSGQVSGFEALSRGPAGSPLESPTAMLEAATEAGRLAELDWLCRVQAMQAAAASNLHPSLSWLINVEPAGLNMECPPHLRVAFAQAQTQLRVILEVVERDVQGYATDLLHATDQARGNSWGVALDDVGAEEGSLALLPFLRPDVVKLDMSLVQDVSDRKGAAITAAVRAYAESTGAVILAEGIETEEQEKLAVVFGATFAQGYRYGRPEPLPEFVPPPRHVIPLRQQLPPLSGQTPFEILTADRDPQRGEIPHLQNMCHHLEEQSINGGTASILLVQVAGDDGWPDQEPDHFRSLAQSNALTVVMGPDLPSITESRYTSLPLEQGSRRNGEHAIIVINPYYAAAFASRDCGDHPTSSNRRVDWTVTYERDNVIAAARGFLQELRPVPVPFLFTGPDVSPQPTPPPKVSTTPERRGFLRRR